jgi:hypothetical protein
MWLGAQPAPSRAIVIESIKDDERVVANACRELIEVARLPMATDLCNDERGYYTQFEGIKVLNLD